MKFNPKAKLDRSQVRNRGGGSGGSGRSGFPLPGGRAGGLPRGFPAGGGVVGLILVVIVLVVAARCGAVLPDGSSSGGDDTQGGAPSECMTGADAGGSQECRILATVNSVQAYWAEALPDQAGVQYESSQWQNFRGTTSSGCGQASSSTGPFYCPVDQEVYIDLTFFDAMLEDELGATGGDFAEAYVVAHEYGHHVQHLLGTLGKYQSRETGPTSPSVRIELQADCYAGSWAHSATTTTDENGEPFILELSEGDIAEAIDAATAVGDDRIQERTQGRVNPEQWTHGSAQERVDWFMTGYESGTIDDCDTFSTDDL
jgi:predicted metalloprotease